MFVTDRYRSRWTDGWQVETIEFSATRVRQTEGIPLFDDKGVEETCESGEDSMACEMVRLGFNFPMVSSEP